MQEIVRRLSPERARMLAKNLKFEIDQPLPELEPQFYERLEFSGNLQIDLTIVALGQSASMPCRLHWTANLTTDEDQETGETIRVLDQMQQSLFCLIPTGEKDPAFEWAPMSVRVLPAAAIAQLDDQVEELARMMEETRKS
ncbi:hypothetical protein [Sphingomonas sp. JC676]|uniref:hypothetical protein n=1 Tax=Sphingomonas sp. JC676 TaxID=2768065 RepID=UPI001CA68E75|nr:hypothetical protein [Sphingomonas sp. JC676]